MSSSKMSLAKCCWRRDSVVGWKSKKSVLKAVRNHRCHFLRLKGAQLCPPVSKPQPVPGSFSWVLYLFLHFSHDKFDTCLGVGNNCRACRRNQNQSSCGLVSLTCHVVWTKSCLGHACLHFEILNWSVLLHLFCIFEHCLEIQQSVCSSTGAEHPHLPFGSEMRTLPRWHIFCADRKGAYSAYQLSAHGLTLHARHCSSSQNACPNGCNGGRQRNLAAFFWGKCRHMKCLPRRCLLEHLKGILFFMSWPIPIFAPLWSLWAVWTLHMFTWFCSLEAIRWSALFPSNTVWFFVLRTANTIGHYMQAGWRQSYFVSWWWPGQSAIESLFISPS